MLPVCREGESPTDASGNKLCNPNEFGRPKVIIDAQNWDSTLYNGQIMQVIMMERMQIPVEFNDEGTHENGASVDFYRWTDAAKPSWYGGKGYPFQALEQGNTDFSCNTKLPEYGCAHV
eukprot:g1500.t1